MLQIKTFLILSLMTGLAYGSSVSNLWPTKNVSVCFAPKDVPEYVGGEVTAQVANWTQKNKDLVRSWVKAEFSEERTGINFIGWKDCAEAPKANVTLFYNDNGKLANALSPRFDGRTGLVGYNPHSVQRYPNAANSITLAKKEIEKSVVVSKFGQVAGLGSKKAESLNESDVKLLKKLYP